MKCSLGPLNSESFHQINKTEGLIKHVLMTDGGCMNVRIGVGTLYGYVNLICYAFYV